MASCTHVRFEALEKRSSAGWKNCLVGPYENARVDNGVRGRLRALRGRMVRVDKHMRGQGT